ncbi:MAG: antitoxin [Acidimicrobiales bacterium]
MGIFDRMKDLAEDHADKLDDAVDKAADVVDDKTKHKHSDKIDSAADKAKGFIENLDDDADTGRKDEPPSRLTP